MHCSESLSVNIANIGYPPEMSVLQLAELVIRLSGSKSKIISESFREDDPELRCPNISRAREVLKWEPHVPIAKGPKVILERFAERLGNLQREAPAP
jgi:nucleoside-diphosphate-sugar epimerase